MVIFIGVLVAISMVAPVILMNYTIISVDYDEEDNRTSNSISKIREAVYYSCSIICAIMLMMNIVLAMVIAESDSINNAHYLRDLEHERVYNILQKFEHRWATYYYVQHTNGEAGLYFL